MSTCYKVFFNFRGPDTHLDIADILYTNLIDVGIRAYRDNEELRTGEEIGPVLLQAIEQSKILIPIFSKGYANSKWRLTELVQTVKCKRATGQKIVPIFFGVRPSEVRNQIGDYGEAFLLHVKKKQFDENTMLGCKAALNEIGALKGMGFPKQSE
ncbi:TMV resistance protein N-like [Eucalyptus grandis]|uniref:TMV resistance protein N-like n=1 Tax=Eucalyptus grandis TaxID=71139 RepID=UPI00192ECCD6|nr:TMV resistance protein N-like [Eucalyptus grandis]